MAILGPVSTNKSNSYIQIRDLFNLAKKYKFNTIILCEPHPKSWMKFIYFSKQYNIKPIILYKVHNTKYIIKNEQDILIAIKHYNKLKKDLNLEEIKFNLPTIFYPTKILKNLLKDDKNLSISEGHLNSEKLKIFENIKTNYNLNIFNINIPNFGGYQKLTELLNKKKYTEKELNRLKKELSLIKELNTSNYILTVKKIIDTAKQKNITIGPGRGSSVSSLVVKSLGITQINPLKYDLLFERFLNKYRKELPDIDIDIDAEKRNELIQELENVFGKYHVAQIRTTSTMKKKSVLKKLTELTKVKEIPNMTAPIRSKENLMKFKKLSKDKKILYNISYYLEGLETAESVHAAGIIISDKDLREYLPLEYRKIPVIEWDMNDLKLLNIEKFDLLSLDTISFMNKLNIEYHYENLNNKIVYENISKGLTKGIFQLDSKLGKILSQKIKPSNFEELILLLSINRPGPLESGMIDEYIEKSSPNYLKKLFPETNGVLIYQEQIMKLAQNTAKFTPEESDELRKALSKKNNEKLLPLKNKFIENTTLPEPQILFEKIENFAKYSFVKSHATAYAHISYWLAEKKFTNPEKFFLEYINSKGLDINIINECSILNIKIISPSIEYSTGIYKKNEILLPLHTIKGIGKNISKLLFNNKIKTLESFVEYCKKNNINKGIMENLIKSGSLDFINTNRKQMLRSLTKLIQGELYDLKEIQNSIFGNNEKEDKKVETTIEDKLLYDCETIGFPITALTIKKLSNTLIKKYYNNDQIHFNGYQIKNFLVDNSSIIEVKTYSKKAKRILTTL
ncbi:hypothetical protein OSSY52_10110 [Tepiditoga spiralis]|uniref:DNA-directed DNA polymerase n=1 Tax=Tepiditoga spiralis TaxID=2108365 RepID=A0A7G1G3A0_9BACT|nr:DNA polymerase III subunit alpha [Tepiditoga spiralis]BBE30870.1 hypothetical protein OSSY52_10110 [Tepiditoga spiralis]